MKNQKNKVIAMRLTPEDNQFIEEQAEKERLTKSSWMRRQIFLKQEIDYAILLSWNYKKFFLTKSLYSKKGGKFIIPLPFPHIK